LEWLVLQNSQENAWKLAVLQLNCVESGTFFWDLRLMGSAKLLLHQKVNFHHLISTWTNRKDGSQEMDLKITRWLHKPLFSLNHLAIAAGDGFKNYKTTSSSNKMVFQPYTKTIWAHNWWRPETCSINSPAENMPR
jgi:hypothetical protein